MSGTADSTSLTIKCVVWDIDNTLLDGVFLEATDPPGNAAALAVLAELTSRGILHALASRNPPAAAQYVSRLTGHQFAAAETGWGRKSDAIRRIMAELDLAATEIAFVDDDALERAEVSFALPDVLVLAPDEMAEAADWPQFSPAVITDEARRRGELYLNRQLRQREAEAFGGSRDDFLRYCQTRVLIGSATTAELPRLHELSVRTHQFNSVGRACTRDELAALLGSARHAVFVVWLADKFGDDGLVGCAVLAAPAVPSALASAPVPDSGAQWRVPLVMMSCRAMGRGVIDALLAWLCQSARQAGAASLALPCVLNPRNVPLRIALTGAGFRAAGPPASPGGDSSADYRRTLEAPLPAVPDWLSEGRP